MSDAGGHRAAAHLRHGFGQVTTTSLVPIAYRFLATVQNILDGLGSVPVWASRVRKAMVALALQARFSNRTSAAKELSSSVGCVHAADQPPIAKIERLDLSIGAELGFDGR